VAGHIKYIRKRSGGVYEYHRRVPRPVIDHDESFERVFKSRPLFRRSLGTRCQVEALSKGQRVNSAFEALLHQAMIIAGMAHDIAAVEDRYTRPVTETLLQSIRANFQHRRTQKWRRAKIGAESSDAIRRDLREMVDERELFAEDLRAVLLDHRVLSSPNLPNISNLAQDIITAEQLLAPEGSIEFDAICRAIREGIIAGERQVDAMLSDHISSLPTGHSTAVDHAPRLSEVVDTHADFLTKKRSLAELRGAFTAFKALHGDLRLNEIKRQHFLEFCRVEAGRNVGEKSSQSISRPLSAETIKKKVSLLRASINRAIKMGSFLGANPAANIDVKVFVRPTVRHLMPDKRPLEIDEINAILAHPWFTGCQSASQKHLPGRHFLGGMYYWVPLLALYTGCRAGELGGLKLSEIRIDDQHPHLIIANNEFRSVKGSYARRVPLLDCLIKHGFDEFVKTARSRSTPRLFEDWLPPSGRIDPDGTAWSNASLLRSFNRTVIPQCLGDRLVEGARREVTFHSLRGAFKTMLQRKQWGLPINYINEIVGHAKDALDQRYVKSIPISETYTATRYCNYEGIQLPSKFGPVA
jgi:integrase